MVQLYNFLGSWQLFPEKGSYGSGERPRSGLYKIESVQDSREVIISHNWTSLEGQGFSWQYRVMADGQLHAFGDRQLADEFMKMLANRQKAERSGGGA